MKSLFNLKLTSTTANKGLTLEDIEENVYKTVHDFITENKIAPDVIQVVITCTRHQFSDIIKRAFYGSVDALYKISEETFRMYLPIVDVTLIIILDPLPDSGRMNVHTTCENRLIPNIVPDNEATKTNVNYQSIEPYFDKARLHLIAREFNPETNEMIIRWQFNCKRKKNSLSSLRISISNPGLRFEENHSSDYILSGNEDSVTIKESKTSEYDSARNVLHINVEGRHDTLLDIRYNRIKGFWEYKICSDNTIIHGEVCFISDNYKPLNDSMTITVNGIGLLIEPIGSPKSRN